MIRDGYYWMRQKDGPWYMAMVCDGTWYTATWEPDRTPEKEVLVSTRIEEPVCSPS